MIIDSPIISGSSVASGSLNQFGNVTITGSVNVSGSFTSTGTLTAQTLVVQTITSSVVYSSGSNIFGNDLANTQVLTGSVSITGSLAVNGSNAVLSNQTSSMSASYALNATSASYSNNATSASYATTASFSLNVPITASYANNANSASYANNATSASYATTASFSLNVPVTSSYANNANSASYALSASFATTASYLTGYISPFPFTGSAIISGSLTVTGSVAVSNLSGSGVRYLVADESGSITAQSASAALKSTQAFTSTAGQTTFAVTNGYSTGYVDVFINGSKLATAEFTDTSGTNIVLATGSFINDTVEVVKYTPALGVTNNVLRQLTTLTASAAQTVFSASYTPGLLDIFYNGARLTPADFTANNGTYFTLATASAANDILDVLVYSYQVGAFSGIGGVGTAAQVAYFDTTNSITGSPNFTISGSTMLITGSLTISGSSTFTNIGPAVFSGSITSTAGFTGSFSGTATSASYAANADLLDGLDSTVFTLTSSFNAQTASFTAFTSSVNSYTASQNITNGTFTLTSSFAAQTASFTAFTSSILSYTSSLNAKTSSFATTSSNTFEGIQTVNSNLIVTGSITAQTLVVQTITSSVDFVTGSTRFGSLLDNTHVFSGSITMNPGGLFVSSSGNVGINTTSPSSKLHVVGSSLTDTFRITDASNYTIVMGYSGSANVGMISTLGSTAKLALGTNSAARLTIDGTGNVGIGTSSPNSILEIQKDTNGDTPITFINGSGGSGNTNASISLNFTLRNGSGGSSGGVILKAGKETDHIGANVNDYFAISTTRSDAMAEKFRISSEGNILLTSGATIYNSTGSLYLRAGTSGDLILGAGGSNDRMRITSAGVLLINNNYASPYGVLNTYKTPVASNYVDQIVVQGTGNYPSLRLGTYDAYDAVIATTGNDLRILAGLNVTTEDHNIMFYTSFNGGTTGAQNYERMRITHAGNVIIQNNKIYGTGEYLGAIWNSNGGNTTWTIGDTPANQTSWNLRVNTSAAKSGGGSWGDSSDGRLKKDVQTIQNALDKINKLNPVTFEWINPEEHNNQYNIGGFIAQEIKEIFPQFVNEINAEGKDKDIVGENEVVYGLTLPFKFDAYIVKAIQEQQALITALQEKLQRNNII